MAGTDGVVSTDDPVLAGALTEMSSEGAFTEDTGDLSPDPTSQPDPTTSAEPSAATPDATGATGSVVPEAAAATPAVDPYEGTEPFRYGANNDKTLEGFLRVPGEGLLVPEDKVSLVTALAERADTLDSKVIELTQARESLERLSEWRTTGEDGKEQVYRGAEGIVQLREAHATQTAALNVLLDVFQNPAKLQDMIAGVDANNVIVFDPQKIADMVSRANDAEKIARFETRQQMVSQYQRSSQPSGPPDYAKTVGAATITQLAGESAKDLTPKDREILLGSFNRYVAQDGKSVAPEFQSMVVHMASLSAARKAEAVASEKAGKFNAGQDKGRITPAKHKAATPAVPVKETGRKKADWDTPLATALAEIASGA